jgi:hypothetical protein
VKTTAAVEEYETLLSVGDTTFLDDRGIKVKREGYGPTGNGGNGLILHSALAIEPQQGQTIGLLWQKLWNREHKAKPPQAETPEQKKQRQKIARKAARQTLEFRLKNKRIKNGYHQLKGNRFKIRAEIED